MSNSIHLRLIYVICYLLLFHFLITSTVFAKTKEISVGVNVYDPYFSPPNYNHEDRLSPTQWHYRLPFYAKITSDGVAIRDDNQTVIDQQIRYAAAAGIDYFSFVYWDWQGLNPRTNNPNAKDMNHFLRFYLSSQYKNLIQFALTISVSQIQLEKNIKNWDQSFIPHLIDYMKDPQYHTVLDKRPIVFLFKPKILENNFTTINQVKQAITRIRSRSLEHELNNPYLVAMINTNENPTHYLDLGFDAVTAYTMHNSYQTPDDSIYPFSQLMTNNLINWQNLSQGGTTIIPTVNIGWDYRPNLPNNNYQNSPIFEQPTHNQITTHLTQAIDWVKSHPDRVPAQTLYIYSWAEFPEGGWLTPTLEDQDQRLNAVAKALDTNYQSPVSPLSNLPPKPGDLNGDGRVDIFDFNLLVSGFGNPYTIFDYNNLVGNFGK